MLPLSLTGKRWVEPPVDPSTVTDVARTLSLPPVVAATLLRRSPDVSSRWLTPNVGQLHDPFGMIGMTAAVERLRRAVTKGERVRIVTDYDVDGTTSSLILQSTLGILGAGRPGARDQVDYHIPHRFGEGYGFSQVAARQAVADGVHVLVTADIGVRDHAAVKIAADGGIDVIVLDHHLPDGERVPSAAYAVLCPPQDGCSYPNQSLAACGISLKLAQALLDGHPRADAFIGSMLKVAAIGTVADVVDLATLENRAIVQLGLASLNDGHHSPGMRALLEVSGLLDQPIDASDLGFRLGPRINAAGRLGDARAVVDLFCERDIDLARARARALDALNRERQGIQQRLVTSCLDALGDDLPPFVVLWGQEADGWHRGVVGIVAAKVRDRVHRPVAIVAVDGDEARGSVRSVPTVHAVRALDHARDLLVRYGGHPAAAGFSINTDMLGALRDRLAQIPDPDALVPEVALDGTLHPRQVDRSLVAAFSRLAPHGKGNPAPLLRIPVDTPQALQVIGTDHLKLTLGPTEVVWWGGARFRDDLRGPFELAATPGMSTWRGQQRVQLVVEDARLAG